MSRRQRFIQKFLMLSVFAGGVAACTGVEGGLDEAEKTGTAPVAVSLQLTSPTSGYTLKSGVTLTGQLTFHDDDGDVYARASRITAPTGAAYEPGPATITGMAPGTTDGTFAFTTEIGSLREVGTYRIEMWVIDQGNNESNELSAEFDVSQ